MEQYGHLAVSLYNVIRSTETNMDYLTSEITMPPRSTNLAILRKREIGIALHGPEEFEDHVQVHIHSVKGLCHGQIIIDAPSLLNKKTWCLQLPRTSSLNLGLTLRILRPGQVQNITISYDPPTTDGCAVLCIAMPAPVEGEPVGILTHEIGTSKRPILTEMDDTDPQSQLMRMARTIAFDGAFARLGPPAQIQQASI